jgi:hypothetical protein
MKTTAPDVHDTMAAINRAWRELRPENILPCLHPEITMVLPGFSGVIAGREAMLAGFTDFCTNDRVIEYTERDEQIQTVGSLAFVSYDFDMLYERGSYHARSTGRDLWAFECAEGQWIAVWRTMIGVEEVRQTVP